MTVTTPEVNKDKELGQGGKLEGFHIPPVLIIGVGCGLLSLWLFDEGIIGPGVLVWLLTLDAGALWLMQQSPATHRQSLLLWCSVTLLAGAMLVVWSTPILIPLMWLVMLACAVQFTLRVSGRNFTDNGLVFQVRALGRFLFQLLAGSVRVLQELRLPSGKNSRHLQGIIKGGLIVLPLLAVFSALFAAADLRFQGLLDSFPELLDPDNMLRLARTLVISWLCCGLLGLLTREQGFTSMPGTRPLIGETETAVILGALCLLFATFTVMQLGYLFGGRESLQGLGISVADYARRGFFELLWVAGLTLLVLGALTLFAEAPKVFQFGALALLGLTTVILLSALHRVWLYVDTFGMTLQRLTALGVLLWIAVAMCLMALKALGRLNLLLPHLIASGIVLALVFALTGPARLVAEVNTGRALAREELPDLYYLWALGDDAVPVLLKKLPAFSQGQGCIITNEYFRPLLNGRHRNHDWRNWNWSKGRVDALMYWHAAVGPGKTENGSLSASGLESLESLLERCQVPEPAFNSLAPLPLPR